MKTILFELYPAKSHHLMVFKTAGLLKNAGYRVIFGSIHEMQELIQQHGFEYHFVPFMVVTPLKQLIQNKSNGIHFPNKKERFYDAKKNTELFHKQVNQIKPDMAILDRHGIISKSFLYEKTGIPVAFVSPMPDSEKARNVPPFSSMFIPRNNILSIKYISFLWFLESLKAKIRYFKSGLFYPGKTNLSIYRKLAKEYGIDPKDIKIPKDLSGLHLQTTPRLVLSATALDFPRPHKNGVYRIGPLIDLLPDKPQSKNTRYEAMKKIIIRGDSAVIYCSLGMLINFCTKQKISLYRKIKKVAKLNPDHFYILCIGEDLDNANLLPYPTNLFVFNSLPQKDLLPHCSVMINHGGYNSITECIFSEVPVIAYPPSGKADHSSNSARVIYHKIGLRGKIWRDSPQAISKKINSIIFYQNFYLSNIRKMKNKFEEKNNSTEVVSIIESIIEDHEKK